MQRSHKAVQHADRAGAAWWLRRASQVAETEDQQAALRTLAERLTRDVLNETPESTRSPGG